MCLTCTKKNNNLLENTGININQIKDKIKKINQKNKKRKFLLFVFAIIVAIIIIVTILCKNYNMKNSKYEQANTLLENGSYTDASNLFDSIISFKDSSDKIKECNYQNGLKNLSDGNYSMAIAFFDCCKDYKDSNDKKYSANIFMNIGNFGWQREEYKYFSQNQDSFETISDNDLLKNSLTGKWLIFSRTNENESKEYFNTVLNSDGTGVYIYAPKTRYSKNISITWIVNNGYAYLSLSGIATETNTFRKEVKKIMDGIYITINRDEKNTDDYSDKPDYILISPDSDYAKYENIKTIYK